MKVSEIFRWLEGNWTLSRECRNLSSLEKIASLAGTASFKKFSADLSVLQYEERGILKMEHMNSSMEAYRRYIYSLKDETISVYFDETPPRLFHQLTINANTNDSFIASGYHLCEKDEYKTEYVFNFPQRFTLYHRIQGPSKAELITSIFTKILSKE